MSFCVVPASWRAVRALLLGDGDVQREQPHGRRVDRHRGVGLGERDAVEQRAHVADVADRHPDLADLAAGELVVRVVAGLGREVERDRQAGLALREVAAVERVRRRRRRVAGVGADHPGAVAFTIGRVRHRTPPPRGPAGLRSYGRAPTSRTSFEVGHIVHGGVAARRRRLGRCPTRQPGSGRSSAASCCWRLMIVALRWTFGTDRKVPTARLADPDDPTRSACSRRSPGCRAPSRRRCCAAGWPRPASAPP